MSLLSKKILNENIKSSYQLCDWMRLLSNKYQLEISNPLTICLIEWVHCSNKYQLKKSNPLTICVIEWVYCSNKYQGKILNPLTLCLIEWVYCSNKYQLKILNPLTHCLIEWVDCSNKYQLKISNPLTLCLIEWVDCSNKYQLQLSNPLTPCVIAWVDCAKKYQIKSHSLFDWMSWLFNGKCQILLLPVLLSVWLNELIVQIIQTGNANPFRKINVFGKVKEEGCQYISFIFLHCISQWCLFVLIIYQNLSRAKYQILLPTGWLNEFIVQTKYQLKISNPLTACVIELFK